MNRRPFLPRFGAGALLVVAATLLCAALRPYLTAPNIVLLYLLGVVVAALRLGRNPAFLTAALSVLAFNFFFVPPLYSLRVADPGQLLTFAGLLTVGAVVSSLVSTAHETSAALAVKEAQTATLYRLARDLASASDQASVLGAVRRSLEQSSGGKVALFLAARTSTHSIQASVQAPVEPLVEAGLELAAASDAFVPSAREREVARWSFESRRAAGRGTGSHETPGLLSLPLSVPPSVLGVLLLRLAEGAEVDDPASDRPFLEAAATQTASALQRVRLVEREEEARLALVRGNLERALLNSVSHDLRTPLVTITGALSGVLDQSQPLAPAAQRELLENAYAEAQRLDRFVGNLLDRTRLDAGVLLPKLEPCDLEDLIGCALAASERTLGGRPVELRLPAPADPERAVPLDLVLMTQVLANLLENSARHAPADRPIEIAARFEEGRLRLEVVDHGRGVDPADLDRLFERFFHIPVPEGGRGTGLGLSICKGIVEAHGGTIRALPTPGGGLTVALDLPASADDPSQIDA